MKEFFDYGGPVLWLEAALAFFAVVFVVERILYFHAVRINTSDFLRGIANHVQRKAFAEAIHESSRTPGPVARATRLVASCCQVRLLATRQAATWATSRSNLPDA